MSTLKVSTESYSYLQGLTWAQTLQRLQHMLNLRHKIGLLTRTGTVQAEVKPVLNYL